MMMELDTGLCVPESLQTLLIQRRQLERGTRKVQMFPIGTPELALPEGCKRHVNFRGVFHYRPEEISPEEIDLAGLRGRENEFLNLGPYSKDDIAKRVRKGEEVTMIMEITLEGIEIRSAVATNSTLARQYKYFQSTKEPDSLVLVGVYPDRIISHLNKGRK